LSKMILITDQGLTPFILTKFAQTRRLPPTTGGSA
jgi:hypothetical protein